MEKMLFHGFTPVPDRLEYYNYQDAFEVRIDSDAYAFP
jgi:hypothetical protein